VAVVKGGSVAIPEDWIGKLVRVRMDSWNRDEQGELIEVSDRGIVVTHALHGDEPARTRIYPWLAVRVVEIEPGEEQTQPEVPEQGGTRTRSWRARRR